MDFVIVTTVVSAATAAFQGQQPYDLVDLPTLKAELNLTDGSKDALAVLSSILVSWRKQTGVLK